MLTKFFLGVAIVAFTSFCGYILAKKYRQRKLFFTQFKEFNERFLSEVSYFRRPLREFVSAYVYKGEFNLLLEDFFSDMESGRSFGYSVLQSADYAFLKKEEKRVVEDYFLMLGKGDSSSQKGYFSAVKIELSRLQTDAATTCKKYGDLYIKIGFLFGLLILILII